MSKEERLEEKDRKFIWHPFTQMKDWEKERPVIMEEGRGCFLRDTEGNWYLDGVSSLWVNIHGHRRREIDEALKAQIDKISHSTMLGQSSVPAILLAERLAGIIQESGLRSPGSPPSPRSSLNRVFYSDNGSTSVEVALKMAFQYWRHRGARRKDCFVSLNNAYHGDTLGAVSVGGISIFHDTFRPLLFKTFRAPSPYCYRCELGCDNPGCGMACLSKMDEMLRAHHEEIAALIIEPLVQAAGGMIVSPKGYLGGVRELCTKYDVLMIADEVATGFGRTGRMFACEHEEVQPDLLCLSKGITGGYLPLAVTVATEDIYNAFLGEFREMKTFFHGHSYTGNQLGCAAALACLDVFAKEGTLDRLGPKIAFLEKWLGRVAGLPHVGDSRGRGLMAGVELVKDKKTKEPYPWEDRLGWQVAEQARRHGVVIRPLGNVVVIMPPLAIEENDLGRLLDVIEEAIGAVT